MNGQSLILEQYIKDGLQHNLALQQKQDNYEKSLVALREAKSLFYPSVSLNARYTVAEGGRIIEFPVGDLLNPVYQTLNQLTGNANFPMLENQEFPFYRPHEQETKIVVVQPIINTQVYYNKKIQQELSATSKTDAEVYKGHLIKEIKAAYYNYLKAERLYALLLNTRKLVEENIRVNESLFANDKVTVDAVLRAQAELSKLEAQIADAEKMVKISAAYFNFLLNRPHETKIIIDTLVEKDIWLFTEEETVSQAATNRSELLMLEQYSRAADLNYKMNQHNRLPTLLGMAEYGFQGEQYKFNADNDYMMASLVLRWNIFSGFHNNSKVKEAKIQKSMFEKQYAETKSKIELEARQAWYDMQASLKAIDASQKQSDALKKAFEIIGKKYQEGQASLIEFIDARTMMTNADENLIINRYDYLIKKAELERVTNSFIK
jgi:outer membrane protein TolC